jgi:serine/threonine protein kinase
MDIKICDFGFSRIIGQSDLGLEEIRYSRPRPLSKCVSFENDCFAIGCLLYEILEGRMPYAELDDDGDSIERRYASRIFPPLDNEMYGYSTIIRKCWNQQYQSTDGMVEDLPLRSELAINAYKRSISMIASLVMHVEESHDSSVTTFRMDDFELRLTSLTSSYSPRTKHRRPSSAGSWRAPIVKAATGSVSLSSVLARNESRVSLEVCTFVSELGLMLGSYIPYKFIFFSQTHDAGGFIIDETKRRS